METLGEALPKEIARVRELIIQYNDPMLNGSGKLAAMMMENSLREADQAMITGDLQKMIVCYEDLKGYE